MMNQDFYRYQSNLNSTLDFMKKKKKGKKET